MQGGGSPGVHGMPHQGMPHQGMPQGWTPQGALQGALQGGLQGLLREHGVEAMLQALREYT